MRLAEAIRADRVSPGQVSIWWLGQAGFAFKTAGALVLIDPYLSDYCRDEWGAVRKLQAREGYTNLGGDPLREPGGSLREPQEATLDPHIFVETYRKLGGEAEVVIPEIGERILVSARAAVAA